MEGKEKYRKHELEKYSSVGVTRKGYDLLRREKGKQKKSMMRIIDNLIKEKYDTSIY